MMRMRLLLVSFGLLAVVCGGQGVPAAGSGSFDAAAKAFEQKLNSIGRVSWVQTSVSTLPSYQHKKKAAKDGVETWQEISQVSIKPGSCEMALSFSSGRSIGGNETNDNSTLKFFLDELASAAVLPYTDSLKRQWLNSSTRVDTSPVLYAIPLGETAQIVAPSQDLANQIAAQLRSLSEQCKASQAPPASIAVAGGGPSLEDTLNFIADKLNQQANVSYTIREPTTANTIISEHVSNATAETRACLVTFHVDGQSTYFGGVDDPRTIVGLTRSYDVAVVFRRVEKIDLADAQSLGSKNGSAANTYAPDPFELIVTRTHGEPVVQLYFLDAAVADRVAKAMIHAVELCGGGNKDPF